MTGLIITETIFPHEDIHKLTWRSPDGRSVNQIERVFVNRNNHENIYVRHPSDERSRLFSDH